MQQKQSQRDDALRKLDSRHKSVAEVDIIFRSPVALASAVIICYFQANTTAQLYLYCNSFSEVGR